MEDLPVPGLVGLDIVNFWLPIKKKKNPVKCYFATNCIKPRWIMLLKAACDSSFLLSRSNWDRGKPESPARSNTVFNTESSCVVRLHLPLLDSLAKGSFAGWKLLNVPMQHRRYRWGRRTGFLHMKPNMRKDDSLQRLFSFYFLLTRLQGYFQHRSQI